jgi:D-serine deaminase-like pyridoxal phosphate-dependent protein
LLKNDVNTPQAVVNIDILDLNIKRMNDVVKQYGVKLRPHIKTHRTPAIAHRQLAAGACGIAVAKLGEAEMMAACGIKDILVAYPIVGVNKVDRLFNLACDNKIRASLDNIEVARGISEGSKRHDMEMEILVEIEIGVNRCGVLPSNTVDFVKKLIKLPGIKFAGIMTYEGRARSAENMEEVKKRGLDEGKIIVDIADKIEKSGILCPIRSAGSTPTAPFAASIQGVTEVRCGNYVFNDVVGLTNGVASVEQCALNVICTVVSCPTENRIIIDGGSKTFTSDMTRLPGKSFGFFPLEPELILEKLNEEHGIIRVPKGYREIKIGEKLEIIPNHACVVPNLMEYLYIAKGEKIIGKWPVLCRGKSR